VLTVFFSPKDLEENQLYLIMSSAAKLRNNNIELIKTCIAADHHVLVITTNQLYDILKKNYEKNGIPMDKIYVIDAVTKYARGGSDPRPVKNCRFIGNPGNLTEMGIAVTEFLKELEGKKACLLFDSINSTLIYISSQNVTKFIHFVTNKLRMHNFSGIFLAVEKGLDPDVLTKITLFVDTVIDADLDSTNISWVPPKNTIQ
jgi:KaiC/GvpD/RAD55 family RecA-like ATPase